MNEEDMDFFDALSSDSEEELGDSLTDVSH